MEKYEALQKQLVNYIGAVTQLTLQRDETVKAGPATKIWRFYI